MQIVAILIGLVLAVTIGWYISRPLLQKKRLPAVDAPVLSLAIQRDSLYSQISELDLDQATGKINDEDYQRLRSDLVAQAANALRQIDGQKPAAAKTADDVEALIAARRKKQPAAKANVDQQIEDAIKSRRSGIVCPQCGKPATSDDVFCSRCGTALKQPQKA
jgi:hypothetical protein